MTEDDLSPRQRALAGEFVKEGHSMDDALRMAKGSVSAAQAAVMKKALQKICGRREYEPRDFEAAHQYKTDEGIWTVDEYLADSALAAQPPAAPVETDPVKVTIQRADELLGIETDRLLQRAVVASGTVVQDQLPCSAGTEDAEKAEVAERFRLFGEKGFRPEVFGIDDRVPGPMVTQRDCMLIAAALSTVEPQTPSNRLVEELLRKAIDPHSDIDVPALSDRIVALMASSRGSIGGAK